MLFANVADDLSDEDLVELDRGVRAVTEQPGWLSLLEIVREVQDRKTRLLMYGKVEDHATVSRDIGYVAGLDGVKEAAEGVLMAAERRRQRIEANLGAEA